ncbi:putative steroid-binding protein 3 [Platanthera zijinensis]|uniref:Steroid-binding protein 3 n=1 Tax=Platanthera zijinensis TaxID=2320716 RepID=A0AAP0B488_9ASPA
MHVNKCDLKQYVITIVKSLILGSKRLDAKHQMHIKLKQPPVRLLKPMIFVSHFTPSVQTSSISSLPDRSTSNDQLSSYDGLNESKPIYVSIRGTVFDISTGNSFYGPGGPYDLCAVLPH